MSERAQGGSDWPFWLLNAALSAAALSLLFWLLVLRRPAESDGLRLSFMPSVNAALNGSAALLLLGGRLSIARGNRQAHRAFMLAAFAASALFLLGYVAYHFVHGDTRYAGPAGVKAFYLLVLASHVLLSLAVVPLVLAALRFALLERWPAHVRVVRWLWPIWMYVSVTGVLVYFLLHRLR